MKSSSLSVSIASRTRQAIVLALAIFFGMIFSLSAEAKPKDDHRLGNKNASEIRKNNRRYARACVLLEKKRNYVPKKRDRKVKWR